MTKSAGPSAAEFILNPEDKLFKFLVESSIEEFKDLKEFIEVIL
tara:strand:- start:478 stop:609 length:132 start_codon:yes stop_codon:yes gene_type:complete